MCEALYVLMKSKAHLLTVNIIVMDMLIMEADDWWKWIDITNRWKLTPPAGAFEAYGINPLTASKAKKVSQLF